MNTLYFFPAFAGTMLSITCLSYLAWKEHDPHTPKTLSQLAARNKQLVNWFRWILWVCGTLFAVTMYGFVIPASHFGAWIFAAWTIYYVSESLLAIFPANNGISRLLHNVFAYTMSLAMLATAALLALSVHKPYGYIGTAVLAAMVVLGTLTIIDRKRFIFYELPFIYLSHVSILIGVIALS